MPVMFRVLQGAVAGPMIPLSQSLLLMNYPDEKKGMALSISVALWDRRESFYDYRLTEHITAFNPLSQHHLTQLQGLGLDPLAAAAVLARTAARQAHMLATNDFFWLSGWIFVALLLLVWFARPPFTTAGGGADAAGDHASERGKHGADPYPGLWGKARLYVLYTTSWSALAPCKPSPDSRRQVQAPSASAKGVHAMSTVTTKDGTQICYNDGGKGQPAVFSHGWPVFGVKTPAR